MVQFLQMLLKEGKLSEEQALAYVDAIKRDIEVVEEKEAKEEMVKEEEERTKAQEQAKADRYNDFANGRQIIHCIISPSLLITLIRFK